MCRRPVGRMPLTTRFLFEVMLESKIDPCTIDKFGLHRDQNPHPLKITKDAPPRVKNKTNGKSKTETSQGNGNQNKFTNKFGLHRDQNPHPLKITKGAPPRVKNKSKSKTNHSKSKSQTRPRQVKIQNHRQGNAGTIQNKFINQFPSAIHKFRHGYAAVERCCKRSRAMIMRWISLVPS